jgi:transcription antitermination factor NusG
LRKAFELQNNKAMNEKWHAVQTRQHCERKVAEQLTRKKIETYCPLQRKVNLFNEKKKMSVEPLFDCLVFVRITESEQTLVKKTSGVVNFMYWLADIAVITEVDIEVLKQVLEEYNVLSVQKIKVNLNDTPRIMKSQAVEKHADLIEFQQSLVNVVLPSLGYQLIAQPAHKQVEIKPVTSGEAFAVNNFYETGFTKNYV